MSPVKPALGLRGVWGAEPHDLAEGQNVLKKKP